MKIYYTGWGRHNKFIISEISLENNPLVAFEFGIIEAKNKQEAEQKSKEIFTERLNRLLKKRKRG